jgi:hypothetical protein
VSRRTPSGHLDTVKIRRPGQCTALVATGGFASTGVVVGLVGAGPPDSVVPPKGPADLWTPAVAGRLWFAVLQVTALVAPTVHAWYLTWGLPLAGTASRWAQQATVAVCVALESACCTS